MGRINRESKRVIYIKRNSDAGTDFNDWVLGSEAPGDILLYETGEMKYRESSEERILTDDELKKVKDIFDDAQQKLLRLKAVAEKEKQQSNQVEKIRQDRRQTFGRLFESRVY